MNRVTIDLTGASTKDAIQDILVSSLSLPEYYGRNLDALYDCVSTMFIKQRTEINMVGFDSLPEELMGYGNSIRKILQRIARESIQVSDATLIIVK